MEIKLNSLLWRQSAALACLAIVLWQSAARAWEWELVEDRVEARVVSPNRQLNGDLRVTGDVPFAGDSQSFYRESWDNATDAAYADVFQSRVVAPRAHSNSATLPPSDSGPSSDSVGHPSSSSGFGSITVIYTTTASAGFRDTYLASVGGVAVTASPLKVEQPPFASAADPIMAPITDAAVMPVRQTVVSYPNTPETTLVVPDFADLAIFRLAFDQVRYRAVAASRDFRIARTLVFERRTDGVASDKSLARISASLGARYFDLQNAFGWDGRGGILGRSIANTETLNMAFGPHASLRFNRSSGPWHVFAETEATAS
ncbi:MAG: hypothetical protein KDA44_04515 [Planctomycetales bacterium]|nr:hypothetical protein [Planctomycetales bacterium]